MFHPPLSFLPSREERQKGSGDVKASVTSPLVPARVNPAIAIL